MQLKKNPSQNITEMYGIGLFAFVLFLSTLMAIPVLPGLSSQLGASDTQIPIVLSAALATVVIVQFFTGILADRYSRRTLILVGALLGSISSFLCVIATHWTQLLSLRILGGIADAVAMPSLLAITSTLGKDQPGRFFGILRGSQGMSFVLGPAIGSLFSLISLRTPFLADGILSLVVFLAAFKLIRDKERAPASHSLNAFKGIKQLLRSRSIYLYLLLGISAMFSFGVLESFVPTKAQILGLSPWQIGAIMVVGALVHSIVSFSVGSLSDKYGRRLFAIVAQPVIVISGIALFFCNNFYLILIVYGIFCIGQTITFLLSFVYASESFEQKYIATSMGIFDSLIDLSLFVAPLISISVFNITDRILYPFIIAVIPASICLIFSFSLPGRKTENN